MFYKAWIFTHPDTWTPTDDPEWQEGEDGDAYMKRLGYADCHERSAWGQEGLGGWELYQAQDSKAVYQYVLVLTLAQGECVNVWLPTPPDLMAYMRLYGSIGQEKMAEYYWERLHTLLKRLFRTYHGHDPDGVCKVCDPTEFAARQLYKSAARS